MKVFKYKQVPSYRGFWRLNFLLPLLCLIVVQPVHAQSFSVPIKFKIEDGGFDGAQILVQRNGVTSQTIPGTDRLTLELAYNAAYIISFTKPGYITKRISINTTVPADRLEQGFEPYAYGVNLFKQYEGVNTVIFNQPVAKIAYSKKIDDFDYDVDYTKSVQSAMKEAEEETKKQAEIEKKKEAEKLLEQKQQAAEALKIKKEEDRKAAEEQKKIQIAEQAAKKEAEQKAREEEKLKAEAAKAEAEKQRLAAVAAGEEKKKNARAAGGQDPKPEAKNVSGEDPRNKAGAPGGGEDKKGTSGVAQGQDKRKPQAYMVSGADAPPENKIKPASGRDLPAKKETPIDDGGVQVEEIHEPNRTITKVTVRNPEGVRYVYTKVAYNWGATYYFRNGTLSIPEYIYQLYTKMK